MNWTRRELVLQAREAMHKSYWKPVLAAFLSVILAAGVSLTATVNSAEDIPTLISDIVRQELTTGRKLDDQLLAILLVLAGGLLTLATLLKILIAIFFKNPIEVGIKRMYLRTLDPQDCGAAADLLFAFDANYRNVTKVQLKKELVLTLCYLLLLVPGVIRDYQYRLVPYLLCENPDLTFREVCEKSKAMMKGNKKRALLLDLSFVPWYLFGVLTLGIGLVFYVIPRKEYVDAGLYQVLKTQSTE